MNYCNPNSGAGKAKLAALDALLDELSYAGVIEQKMAAKDKPEEEQAGDEPPPEQNELAELLGDEGPGDDESLADGTGDDEEEEGDPKAMFTIDMTERRRLPPSKAPVKKRGRA